MVGIMTFSLLTLFQDGWPPLTSDPYLPFELIPFLDSLIWSRDTERRLYGMISLAVSGWGKGATPRTVLSLRSSWIAAITSMPGPQRVKAGSGGWIRHSRM